MGRFNFIKNSFLSGELSPKMYGRSDLPQYAQGLKTLQNFAVYPQGGAYRRPGSIYHPSLMSNTANKIRVFPFSVSSSDKYIVVIDGQGQSSWYVQNISTGEYDDYLGVGTNANFIGNTAFYTDDQLDSIQYAQIGDILILTHPEVQPIVIRRDGRNKFQCLSLLDAFLPTVSTGTTLYAQRLPYETENDNTSNTVTWSAATGTGTLSSNHDLFHTGYIQARLKIRDGATTGWARITAVTNAREAAYEVITGEDLPAASTVSTFAMQAWNNYSGWPKSVVFFQQRAYWVGPGNMIWLSQLGNYANMSETSSAATDPTSFEVSSSESVTELIWANVVGNDLAIGSISNEFVARPFDQTDSISAANPPTFRPHSHIGSSLVQATRHDYSLSFVDRSGKTVQTIKYDLNRDAYIPEDLSILSDHMVFKRLSEHASYVRPQIIQMSYQSKNKLLWCLDNNGGLFAATVDPNNQIVAWHNHILGGSLSSEACKVISICTITSANGLYDQLWMTVKRTINSATVYCIEYLNNDFDLEDTYNSSTAVYDKPVYVDYAIVARRAAVSGRQVATITEASAAGLVDNGATNSIITFSGNHNYAVGDQIQITTSNTIPTGLLAFTAGRPIPTYVSEVVSATQIRVGKEEFRGGIIGELHLRITSDGVGNQTFTHGGITKTLDVNTGTNLITLQNGNVPNHHYFNDGDAIVYTASGTAIGGLTSGNTYYIRDRTNNAFKLASTAGGSAIALSTVGVGTHTFTPSATTSTTFDGFDHLEGQTVAVVADGFYVGEKTVSGGAITLSTAATEVIVGLPYDSILETLSLEAGSQIGSSQAEIKRIDRIAIRFNRTIGGKYGFSTDDDDLDDIVFRPAGLNMDEQIPLFTGDKVLDMLGSPDRHQHVVVKQDYPFPMSITAIVMRGISHEG